MTHPIAKYLKAKKLTVSEFSRLAKVSRPSVSRVVHGRRACLGREACVRVVEFTSGAITLDDLINWRPPETASE